jgi:hypothetical protein
MVGEITENNMADAMGNMSPEEYAQQQALTRQQQMATLLMQQGIQNQPQGQMVSGRYVPTSFFQNLLPIANIAASKYVGEKADTEQAKLAQAIRQNRNKAEQRISDLAFGTPAIPGIEGGIYDSNNQLTKETTRDMYGADMQLNPQYKQVASVAGVEATKPDLASALREINTNMYGAGKEIKPLLYKQMMPEATPEEKRFKAAVSDGSWNVQKQGGLNAFLNQMSDKDKASLENDKVRLRNEAIRLGMAQQEQAFNLGLPMVGGGGAVAPQVAPQGAPQAPLRTINPGSPILAPGQQQVMPQNMNQGVPQAMPQGQMPVFGSKAEQDIYVATQKEKGRLLAEAQNALPGALLTAQTGIDTIRELIGDTKVDAKGNIVYGKQRPKAGFEQTVGMPTAGSLFGLTNLFPGSDAADFKAAFEQTSGQAFLGAIGTLKGSGAISEAEGAKATSALNRMKLSQSEVEFIRAANDFKDVLEKGYKAAQQRAGGAPINLNAQPNLGGTQRKLVYNQATGTLE